MLLMDTARSKESKVFFAYVYKVWTKINMHFWASVVSKSGSTYVCSYLSIM